MVSATALIRSRVSRAEAAAQQQFGHAVAGTPSQQDEGIDGLVRAVRAAY
ncbi:hypothetical protein HLK59_03170 [Streptomyces sp. S3(2020)]|nr:hypothetical protein [Streptomyces sp. S3(2020)]NNN29370.1 hypothetical protein [Streptomyces sp. S3(2020)]